MTLTVNISVLFVGLAVGLPEIGSPVRLVAQKFVEVLAVDVEGLLDLVLRAELHVLRGTGGQVGPAR